MNICKQLAVVFLFFCAAIQAFPEVITDFDSDITVHADATMTVRETIYYTNNSRHGLRGIYRDFPTTYKDRWGNTIKVGFEVLKVTRNGAPVEYHTEFRVNGTRVYIGSANAFAPIGDYVYIITYATNRQLGFFENTDELYWNVTGNGWGFPIQKARATVHLPGQPLSKDIAVEGYTGAQGARNTEYNAQVLDDSTVLVSTTATVWPGQGLTIAVSWPKGFVQEPTWWMYVWYLLRDNRGLLWLLCGLALLCGMYFVVYRRFATQQRAWSGAIIPRFYPPRDILPSMARYIVKQRFDTTAFAAEIVHMAVHGLVTIHYEESGTMWKTSGYTLSKKTTSVVLDTDQAQLHSRLSSALFGSAETLKISNAHHEQVRSAIATLKRYVDGWGSSYCNFNYATVGTGVVITLFFGLSTLVAMPETSESSLAYLLGAIYVLVNVAFAYSLRGYTKEGLQIYEEIEGFKLFLETAETERLKIIGTPPTKTPELYETYLPYAIALGVEEQWSNQFAPIFKQFESEGHPYVPVWYVGSRPFRAFGNSSFAQQFSSSLNSAIASASTPPGSSSGSGGRGGSGGGGGGGGGGSW